MRVTTRLVQVNVVAQDKKGQPITGLAASDFEVSEQGKAQKIAVFSMESNQKPVGRGEPLPANTFSNMPSRAGASQNLTVILFDTLNTPVADQLNAKKQMIDFLQQIKPQDRVAIYGLANGLRVVHDFTGDAQALVRAVARYKTRFSKDLAASKAETEDHSAAAGSEQEAAIIAQMDAFLNESNRLAANVYLQRRVAITLETLEAISNHLAAVPGRKSLVWVSGSFPFSYGDDVFLVNRANEGIRNFSQELARVTRAITSANVAIYPVDARGMRSAASLSLGASAETTASRRQAQRTGTDGAAMDKLLASHNTMLQFADRRTGALQQRRRGERHPPRAGRFSRHLHARLLSRGCQIRWKVQVHQGVGQPPGRPVTLSWRLLCSAR